MDSKKEYIVDLSTLCGGCGFFNNESHVNNGFCCTNLDCGDGEWIDKNEDYVNHWRIRNLLAMSFTKRNIKCNKRLAKKYLKKIRNLSRHQEVERLKQKGIRFVGACYSFTCPIAYEVSFDSLSHYENHEDYDHIEKEEDMPWGWGDDLMAVDEELYNKLK